MLDYIPLIVVFFIVVCSVLNRKFLKYQNKTRNTLDKKSTKREAITNSRKIFDDDSVLKTKTLGGKNISSNHHNILEKKNENVSSFEEIENIRKAIVYVEILNRKE